MADTRRRFLTTLASTGTVLALAGCSGSDGDGGGETDGEMTEGEMTEDEMTESEMTDGDAMDEGEQMTEGGMSEPVTVTVRIENVAPTDFYGSDSHTAGAVWITPGAYAVHSDGNPIYTEGESASIGLEALAEAGPPTGFEGEAGLVNELGGMNEAVAHSGAYTPADTVTDPNDPTGEVPGAPPIAPGGAFEFDIQAAPGQKLSFASMFVPSNDLFFSPGSDGITLWPEDGEPVSGDVTDGVHLWDAGTEPNGEPGQGPDQAPAQSSPDQGGDEGGVVRRLSDVGDGYSYPAASDAVRVTLTPHGSMDDGESMN